jgi:SAM-dependent methyltransferase
MDTWSTWRDNVDLDGYDARWRKMAEAGQNPHGEADFVCRYSPASVLDAGCGTGRVGIELDRRGIAVVGTDLDPDLLDRARAKAPHLVWHEANLAGLDLGQRFDVVVLAGNVIPYVAVTDRAAAVAGAARQAATDGILIAGFSLQPGWPTAGLELAERYATWDGEPYIDGNYAVSVHRGLDPQCQESH